MKMVAPCARIAPLRRALRARLLRFAVVGASGVVVNLGVLWLLAGVFGIRDVLASASAVEASILWNFAFNNAFTYRDRNAGAQARLPQRLLRYNLVSLVGLGIQLGTFVVVGGAVLHVLHRDSLGALRYLVQCAGILLATGWNFTGHLHFTWRQTAAARSATAGEGTA